MAAASSVELKGNLALDNGQEMLVACLQAVNIPCIDGAVIKLAQMVLAKAVKAELEVVDNLDETRRGAGGFGHTGYKDEIKKSA